jgi:lysozyme
MYNKEKVIEQLKIDEGIVHEIYLDHLGYPTFGIGHLVLESDPEYGQDVGTPVSEERCLEVFDHDLEVTVNECKVLFPDFDEKLNEVQEILINMMFNMGRTRLSKFKKFIGALNEENYDEAANQMMDSRWYNQVGNRSVRLVERMRNAG